MMELVGFIIPGSPICTREATLELASCLVGPSTKLPVSTLVQKLRTDLINEIVLGSLPETYHLHSQASYHHL